jgi:nucleotide-binding universal stress UspA family protein
MELPVNRWTHPGAILVATDLSDLDRLMPVALEQAAETGARLILLHVVASNTSLLADAAALPFYDTSSVLEFAGSQLNVPCDAVVREGKATQQIALAARQFEAGRVILGTRSRGKLGKLLVGSVAEQALRSVDLPVITVGPEAHLPVDRGAQEPVILYATTLRETSRASAALAAKIAADQKGRLVLLHVLPPADEMTRKGFETGSHSLAMRELRQLAGEMAAEFFPNEQNVTPVVVHGNPSIEILAEASGRHASLIVLGTLRHTVFDNLTHDRTISRVLAHARCPVMTLREPFEVADSPCREKQAARQ